MTTALSLDFLVSILERSSLTYIADMSCHVLDAPLPGLESDRAEPRQDASPLWPLPSSSLPAGRGRRAGRDQRPCGREPSVVRRASCTSRRR